MPALMIMLARWVPPHERSFQGALVFGGSQIGNIFGSFMSGVLLADGRDWAYVFYFFGGFGILWFVLWVSTSFLSNIPLRLCRLGLSTTRVRVQKRPSLDNQKLGKIKIQNAN